MNRFLLITLKINPSHKFYHTGAPSVVHSSFHGLKINDTSADPEVPPADLPPTSQTFCLPKTTVDPKDNAMGRTADGTRL